MGWRVNRKFRLTQTNDFKRVRHSGRSYAHPLAIIVVGEGKEENSRVGFLVTRSVGGAVQRNHVKRQLRAIFTSIIPSMQKNVDLVVIPRSGASQATFQEIQTAIIGLLGKAGLIVTNFNDAGR
jgi:ribonuclease P protein component